ncbi:methyltransferase family protein [Prosthecochloris marina]|nr:isoprenylcysteine carboxylmethyltransferase family protein [Prosthecochloris marina]
MKKITPPFLFIICIVIMAGLWWMLPLVRFVPFPINLLGVLVFAVGLGIAKRGSDVFEKEGTNIETFNNPDILVTDGLFRISRNPMYLGFLTALVGMAVMLGNLSSFLVAFVFFIVTDRWYITFEEDAMAKAFGKRYAEYKAKTRRWL